MNVCVLIYKYFSVKAHQHRTQFSRMVAYKTHTDAENLREKFRQIYWKAHAKDIT